MLRRFLRIWKPAHFHYHHLLGAGKPGAGKSTFEGWYFKIVDPDGNEPRAFIPGMIIGPDSHAFIQVLDGARAANTYYRFPLSEFSADEDRFHVRIGPNSFSEESMTLDLKSDAGSVQGTIHFSPFSRWPVSLTSPGAMGPYAFTPLMECYHGILSMDHGVNGQLNFSGRTVNYDTGRGYVEKDWGRSFPAGYVWMQSNHFDRPGISVSASVARIPWFTGAFRGFLAGFLFDGRLHRFTTYTGAKVTGLSISNAQVDLEIADKRHCLQLTAVRSGGGGILRAPYEKLMLERVAEAMDGRIRVRFSTRSGSLIYEGNGTSGCLETVNTHHVV